MNHATWQICIDEGTRSTKYEQKVLVETDNIDLN